MKSMNKIAQFLIYISRIVVGSVFVVSGLIKANDTLGFSYKLEEYFEPAALGSFWTIFEPYALPLAILVCVAEIVLGLSLLFGTRYKLTVILLTAFIVFFGFLTYYTAQCNPHEIVTFVNESGETVTSNRQCVLDCGCFGDALKGSLGRSLTPWESFKKDMVLLFFTVFLYLGFFVRQTLNNERRDKIILGGSLVFTAAFGGYVFGWWMPLSFMAIASLLYLIIKWFYVKKGREWVIISMLVACSGLFVWYTLTYLPVKDYRPYAVGNNLAELRKTSDDFKEEIMNAEYERIMPTYATTIEEEVNQILLTDSTYQLFATSDSLKAVIKMNVHQDVTSKYEDLVWDNASKYATDSLKRANLLPPVYASMYYLQHKETGERKRFSSTAYSAQKLWENWEFVYVLVNKETGETVEVEKKDYNEEEWTNKGYEKQSSPPFVETPGYEPKIPLDFDFNDETINQEVLGSEGYVLLVITWDLGKTKVKAFEKINALYEHAQSKEYKFYAATSKDYLAEEFKATNGVKFDFASADEKILKTIVRSNPGVLLLKGGVVYGKWDKNRIPTPKKLEKFISKLEK